jgi:hypothetical protein
MDAPATMVARVPSVAVGDGITPSASIDACTDASLIDVQLPPIPVNSPGFGIGMRRRQILYGNRNRRNV